MKSISKLADYGGSRDYERLAELAKQSSIICIVDYRTVDQPTTGQRDIARTLYGVHQGEECWSVSARGIGYIQAFGLDDFVLQCKAVSLEFVEPVKSLGDS